MQNLFSSAKAAIESSVVSLVDGGALVGLPGQLDRKDYEQVNEVFVRLGGKWKGNKKAHFFPYDPSLVLGAVVDSGEMPAKNPLDFFPTPDGPAEALIGATSVPYFDKEMRVLDPSGGTGALVRKMMGVTNAKIDTVEFDPLKIPVLKSLGAGDVYCADFMQWEPPVGRDYDAVVMNPPFSYKGNTRLYIDHIMRAVELVKGNRGVVASITPTGWLYGDTAKERDFRNFVAEIGEFQMLPEKSFHASGTDVPTCIVILRTAFIADGASFDGDYRSFTSFQFFSTVENDSKLDKRLSEIKAIAFSDEDAAKTRLFTFLDEIQKVHYSGDVLLSTSPANQEAVWLDMLDSIDCERPEAASFVHAEESSSAQLALF